MEKFKILLVGNENSVKFEEIKILGNNLQQTLINSDYTNIEIMYNTLDTSYKSAAMIMEHEPDVLIFISSDIDYRCVITKDELSTVNKPFIHNLQDYLNKYKKGNEEYRLIQSNIPIARAYPFLSAYINTNCVMNNIDSLSKAIYKAIVNTVSIDKETQDIMYKTTANLNLKKSLDKNSIAITKIPKGSLVKVLEKTNNIYWKVEYESPKHEKYIGYAAQTYIIL